ATTGPAGRPRRPHTRQKNPATPPRPPQRTAPKPVLHDDHPQPTKKHQPGPDDRRNVRNTISVYGGIVASSAIGGTLATHHGPPWPDSILLVRVRRLGRLRRSSL